MKVPGAAAGVDVDRGLCVCLVSEVVSPDLAAAVAPPVVTSPISSTSAREGEPARFHCRVHGDGRTTKANIHLGKDAAYKMGL